MPEDAASKAAYASGVEAGVILQRLQEHDRHFAKINGSMERIADQMGRMNSNLEKLNLQVISDAATRVTTAAAVKEYDEARRQQSVSTWTPLTRVLAVVGAIVGVVGTIITFVIAMQGP